MRHFARQPPAQAPRLLQSDGVQGNVDMALESKFAVPVGFAVAQQYQFGHLPIIPASLQ